MAVAWWWGGSETDQGCCINMCQHEQWPDTDKYFKWKHTILMTNFCCNFYRVNIMRCFLNPSPYTLFWWWFLNDYICSSWYPRGQLFLLNWRFGYPLIMYMLFCPPNNPKLKLQASKKRWWPCRARVILVRVKVTWNNSLMNL